MTYQIGDVVTVREWRRYPWWSYPWRRLLGMPTGKTIDAQYVCVTPAQVIELAAHFEIRPSPPTASGDHHGP